jgi:ancient ubiquitous protein 1
MERRNDTNKQEEYGVFPGSRFQNAKDKNLAGLNHLTNMFDWVRVNNENSLKYLAFLIYFPIGIIVTLIRLIILVPLMSTTYILPRNIQSFCIRLQLFLFVGVWINVKGTLSTDSRILVANHIAEIDAIIIRALTDPYTLMYSFYSNVWWLKYTPLSIVRMILVPQVSRHEDSNGRNMIDERIREILKEDTTNPILLFPEGGLTNFKNGLMQYHKFVFGLNVKIQPIALQCNTFLPINLDGAYSSFLSNYLWFLFLPIKTYTITFLPPVEQYSNETSLEFCRRVMNITSNYLNIICSPFLYSDKKKWLKLYQQYIDKGYDIQIYVDEKNEDVTVIDKNKKLTSIAAKEMLLQDMHDVWDMSNPNFNHLYFAPFEPRGDSLGTIS